MSKTKEYDWLISSSPSEVVKTYDGGSAMGQRIAEWLGTPEGSIADLPGWGNNLFTFKHDPAGINLQVMAEMTLFEKIRIDIPDIDLRRIGVEFPDIDKACVIIESKSETFKMTVAL